MGFGDELMCTGEVKRAQARDPRPVVILDRHGNPRRHALFENNPRIAYQRSPLNQEIINGSSARPYIVGKTDQKWTWKHYRPEPGELYFNESENLLGQQYQGHIFLEPNVRERDGQNKDWGWNRWQALIPLLEGLPLAQAGSANAAILPGVRHFVTQSFREACALLSHSRAFVGTEGGLHHAAAALGLPAVVILGGFISPAVTGYDGHRNLFEGDGLGCGSRRPCQHCREAMHKITPEIVAQNLREII